MVPWLQKQIAGNARRAGLGMVVGLTFVLAGCASTVSTNVTRFHQWPAQGQQASYAIVAAPADAPSSAATAQPLGAAQTVVLSDLEARAYEAQLAQQLQTQGLTPAAQPEQARMAASMAVQSRRVMVETRVPVMRPMWRFGLGYGGGRWRHGVGAGVSWSYPFGYDDYYDNWGERVVMQPMQSYLLRVRIADRGQVAKAKGAAAPVVFDGSAEYTGRPVALNTVMPYLMRAVFHDFPGANGQTQKVLFDAKTGLPVKTP
ncbi:MAG: DUF4136 domain-containing protein [Brachymonas sp.]|nr:DUF4136 domain-containing protein [Brachymonas sp.]